MNNRNRRLIVGISGASGAVFGIRMLEVLNILEIESHLVVTPAGRLTIEQETSRKYEEVANLAKFNHQPDDLAAAISSGAFRILGMAVLPCSIKTLSAIANSYSSNLLTRAADVCLKEGRPVILAVRETPLHSGHLHLMSLAAQAGAVIFPPVPAFYGHPDSIAALIDQIIGRILLRLGIENEFYAPWPN